MRDLVDEYEATGSEPNLGCIGRTGGEEMKDEPIKARWITAGEFNFPNIEPPLSVQLGAVVEFENKEDLRAAAQGAPVVMTIGEPS